MGDTTREIMPWDERYYAMSSDAGNLAMDALVSEAIDLFERHGALAYPDVERVFRDGLPQMRAAGHTECGDTDVREATIMALEPTMRDVGIGSDDAVGFFD